MNSDIAISVRGLGKSYVICHNAAKHVTLAETALARLRHPFRRRQTETFHALQDVSFDVKKGDVVGIIGRNGAGKSTLLKVLSRITEPTRGQIDLFGRVGSLLEVGTGFHPELTGRENIFLNGHILGMRKKEIARQFDAIVDFAGVEQFLDTPVKRYSSGMYVRLAFAVAAHLSNDILIVDEVLSVGDAEFQKKCLGKMKDVATGGRTVLLVSHNMAAVSNLCSRGLFLAAGQVDFVGAAGSAIDRYVTACEEWHDERQTDMQAHRHAGATPTITGARMLDTHGNRSNAVKLGSDIRIEMSFDVGNRAAVKNPVMGVVVKHVALGTVGGVNMLMTDTRMSGVQHRSGTIYCTLRQPPLLQGEYRVDLWLTDGTTLVDMLAGYLTFTVHETDVYESGRTPDGRLGVMYFTPDWEFGPVTDRESGLLAMTRE